MKYKAVGKNVYRKNSKKDKWVIEMKTMSSFHAKKMVKRLEMEQHEWHPKKKK